MKRKSFLVVVLVLTVGLLQAQNVKQLAREVYDNSGVKQQMKSFDAGITNGLNANPAFANSPAAAPFKQKMIEVLSAKNMEEKMLTFLEESVPQQDLETMATLLKNPLVKEFSVLEEKLMSPEAQQDMASFKQQLASNPPSEERTKLVNQLIKDLNVTEMAKTTGKNMMRAMMKGGNRMQSPDRQMTDEQMESFVAKAFTPNMDEMIQKAIYENSLFAYKDVSDEKLAEYVAIWGSEDGKMTMKHIMSGYTQSFDVLGMELGKALATMLK